MYSTVLQNFLALTAELRNRLKKQCSEATVLVVDESRSSPSSPRALSPARATLEPLIRLDRTPVISKHVHDLSNNFFAWTGACQHQSLTCIIGYTVHPGPPRPFARSPLLSALAVPARKRSTLPLGILCRSSGRRRRPPRRAGSNQREGHISPL